MAPRLISFVGVSHSQDSHFIEGLGGNLKTDGHAVGIEA
jgi:hypothetical protein